MTDPSPIAAGTSAREVREQRQDERGKATAIYVLYLVALFTGLTMIVGVVLAYVFRGGAPDWLRSHYDAQVRVFWWGVLWVVVGTLTIPILIGFLILGLSWLYVLVRSVQGLARVNDGRPWK